MAIILTETVEINTTQADIIRIMRENLHIVDTPENREIGAGIIIMIAEGSMIDIQGTGGMREEETTRQEEDIIPESIIHQRETNLDNKRRETTVVKIVSKVAIVEA